MRKAVIFIEILWIIIIVVEMVMLAKVQAQLDEIRQAISQAN